MAMYVWIYSNCNHTDIMTAIVENVTICNHTDIMTAIVENVTILQLMKCILYVKS